MTAAPPPLGPTLLFCPGDRPERFAKAFDAADMVVLDLEDGVGPSRKPTARESVARAVNDGWAERAIVRLNARRAGLQADDLKLLGNLAPRAWMVPKAELASDLDLPGDTPVIALCETAAGIVGARVLAASPRCEALFWGSEDLIQDLGGRASRTASGGYHPLMQHARFQVVLSARAEGKAAIDAVSLDLRDVRGLELEAREAAEMGYVAKAVIHPAQVEPVRTGFFPTATEVAWAQELLAARDAGPQGNGGAFAFDGTMVDAPVLARALRIVRDAAD